MYLLLIACGRYRGFVWYRGGNMGRGRGGISVCSRACGV